ncbi:hypothetical protein BG57_04000 [Caballeronia grimmiae]|nr:hypothetical protein BG57_04000 [Caballeronia grimmiae]
MLVFGGDGPTFSTRDNIDAPMSTPTREEIDAKLEAIEARMDGRLASIDGKIDSFLARMEEREKAGEVRAESLKESLQRTNDAVSRVENSSSSLKYWLIGTAIATVVALASLNATILSNMVASFESGKNTSSAQAQVAQQIKETQELLEQAKKAASAQTQK